MNLNIVLLKRNLQIESTYTDDDALLQNLLDVAEAGVKTYLGVNALTGYTGATMPIEIPQAIIFLASHYYLTRNIVSYAIGTPIPYSFEWLLQPYKDYFVL